MVDFWLDRVNHLYGVCFKTSSQMWLLISLFNPALGGRVRWILVSLSPAYSVLGVPGQPRLYSKTLSQISRQTKQMKTSLGKTAQDKAI